MSIKIRVSQSSDAHAWDTFVKLHKHATLYHLCHWQRVLQDTYNIKTFYLEAFDKKPGIKSEPDKISGILPLMHLRSVLFGNQMISIPYFDMGGVLANNTDTEKALIAEAVRLGKSLSADSLELRQQYLSSSVYSRNRYPHKVRLLLDLPESADELMKGFKSKLRSQIKKAMKEGLKTEIGGVELIDSFYNVFLVNMRDLGSPVHSKRIMENMFKYFPYESKIIIIRHKSKAVAASLVVGFKNILENPWASSLRRFSTLNANMLLYWKMLEYACENGFKQFDFGRSTPNGGTFKFKKQWGARAEPLNWVNISLTGKNQGDTIAESKKFKLASQIWKRLPVHVTRLIGPRIRKQISL